MNWNPYCPMTTATLRLLMPEIALMAAAVMIYLGGAFYDLRKAWSGIAGAAIFLAAALLAVQPIETATVGPLLADSLAGNGRWLALVFGALLLLVASRPSSGEGASECTASLLLTVVGLMLVASANDLVLLFVGLELISIPTYVLLYLGRHDIFGQESTAKYFFLSVLSSAVLLYGFSFLYGAAGSTGLAAGVKAMGNAAGLPPGFQVLPKLAWTLVFAALCFKVTAVPFHFYAPDVYQGTSYPNVAVLSVMPKAAGLLVMIRLLMDAAPSLEPYAWRIVLTISVLTMTLGNVVALWQDDLRRLFAYSSIAHAGYMLIGMAAGLGGAQGVWNGADALWFYLAAYATATVGAFAVLEYLGRPERRIEGVEELAGLGRTRPASAALLALFLFSLTGVPPLAGFWAKFFVFGSALSVGGPWFIGLAIAGALNAAVAAAYYLRLVAIMYFRTPLATPRALGGAGPLWAAIVCAVLVLVIGNGMYPRVQGSGFKVQEAEVETKEQRLTASPWKSNAWLTPQKHPDCFLLNPNL